MRCIYKTTGSTGINELLGNKINGKIVVTNRKLCIEKSSVKLAGPL